MQSDRSKLISGFISMGTSSILRIIFSFLTIMIAARLIPEEQLGQYFLIVAIATLVEVIASFGLNTSATRQIAAMTDEDEKTRTVSTLAYIRILSIIVVVPAVFLARPLLGLLFEDIVLESLFIYIPIFVVTSLWYKTMNSILQGYQYYHKLAAMNTLFGALNLGLTIVLVALMGMSLIGYIYATVIAMVIVSIFMMTMLPIKRRPYVDRDIAREMFRIGIQLQGNDILTIIFTRLDVWLLGALVGATDIAYLEVSARIPNYFLDIYNSGLNSIYFPKMSELLSRGESAKADEFLNHLLRLLAFVTMFTALGLTLFQQEITLFIFSEKYLISAPGMGLLMIGMGFGLASQVLEVALIAAGRPKYLILNNTVMTILTVITAVILVPMYGFMGAVGARILSNVLVYPVVVWTVYRENIHAKAGIIVRGAIVLGICLSLFYGLGWVGFLHKIALFVLFLGLSFGASIITIQDIRIASEFVNNMLRKKRKKAAASG